MKTQTTMKSVKSTFDNVIEIGYCSAWYLFRGAEPNYFTSGIYGWNADIYKIKWDTVISTGYRPFGNVKVDYELLDSYESQARKVWEDRDISYNDRVMIIGNLRNEFVEKLLKLRNKNRDDYTRVVGDRP